MDKLPSIIPGIRTDKLETALSKVYCMKSDSISEEKGKTADL